MTAMIVVLACFYGQGCSESASQYYHQTPELQEAVKYTEGQLKNYMSNDALVLAGTSLNLISGRDFDAPVTKNFHIKGNTTWHTAGLSYCYNF